MTLLHYLMSLWRKLTERTPEETEKHRDEKGRFAKTEAESSEEAEEPVEETQEEETEEEEPEDKGKHRIPLSELLNERERRQNEQRRAEQLQQQLEQMQRQFQAMQQPRQQVPDQFADPDGYNAYWENRFQQQQVAFQTMMQNARAEDSLARAHERYGEDFEKGYEEILDRATNGDRTAAQIVVNSPNPGEAIVNWYKRESVLQQVGT